MQVTITGGTGQIAEFVSQQLEATYDLVLFDRVPPGQNRFQYEIRHPVVGGELMDVSRALAMCLEAGIHGDLPKYDDYYINAADTWSLEDTKDMVSRLRPDLLPLVEKFVGRQAMISTAKAAKAFGWIAEHSWTD